MKKPKGENCGNCVWDDKGVCASQLSKNDGLEVSDTNWCIHHYKSE